jgi:CRP-like cAMP-binding protein
MENTIQRSEAPELAPVFMHEMHVFFPAGSVLFREGDLAEGAYYILSGEVTTSMESTTQGSLSLVRIPSPAYLALVDSIKGEQYSCTSRALRDTGGVFIPRGALLTAMSVPGVNLPILKALAEEVSESYEELRIVRDRFCGRSASRKRVH